MVEVELDLVGGGTDRLVASELELFNEILMGVLCHLSALIGIKEDIVDVERSGNKGLLVGSGDRLGSTGGSNVGNGPETLTNRSDIKVELDLVILYESLIPPLSGYLRHMFYNHNLFYFVKHFLCVRD